MSMPIAPLGELCEMHRQSLRPDDPRVSRLPFVGVENVNAGTGTVSFDTDSRIGGQKSSAFRFDERHVLYAKLRPYLNKVATPGFTGRCSTELVPLLPRDGVDRDFLAHLLRRKQTVEFVMVSVTGTGMPRTDMKALMSMPVPFPSFDEQRRIANVLNRVARLERLRTQAASLLREFISTLFISMFGAHEALSQDWPVATVEQLLASKRGAIRTGPFGSQLKHSEFTGQGVPILGIDNVVTNRFLWTKPRYIPPEKYANFLRYRVFPGDVIVTIMGTTGRVCVAPDDLPECMSTKHLCVLTLDRSLVEPLFVWGALLFDENVRAQTRVQGQGQIMEGWNLTIVKRLQLRIPPIDIQRSFARIVARTMTLGEIVSSSSNAASALSASLMADLLGDTACPMDRNDVAERSPTSSPP